MKEKEMAGKKMVGDMYKKINSSKVLDVCKIIPPHGSVTFQVFHPTF